MCRAVTCKTCGKTTWAGCGQHVSQVRATVPANQWCGGHGEGGATSAANPFVIGALVLVVLAGAWFFVAGNGDDDSPSDSKSDDGGALSSQIVGVDQAKSLIDDGAVVIDVRTPAEFSAGHLAAAENIDFEGDFSAGIADLDKDASYVLYCASGNRAGQAVSVMADAGFTQVVNAGGYADLTAAGLA